MKILYIITRSQTGGAQAHVLELLRSCSERHDVVLATGEEGFLTEEARALRVPVYHLENLVRPIRPTTDARAVTEVYRLIRSLRPDVLHAHTAKAGLVGRIAAKAARVPAVFTAHGWQFAPRIPWSQRLLVAPSEWLTGYWSSHIITVCESDRLMARKLRVGSDERMTVVNYGIPDVAERADPCEADPPTLIMVARFAPQKAQDHLLRALAEVKAPFRLRFVGDGPLEAHARADAARLGLDDRVEFLGLRDDIPSLLAQASIFVLATNWEGLPISILEANRAGLPVIASDVAGVAEGVVDGMTGFVVPAGDDAALRDRILTLLVDAELRKKMGDAARRHYEERFTIDEMVSSTEKVYLAVSSAA